MVRRFSILTASRVGASALVVAMFAAVYTYVFGTDDFEESNIVSWSAGLRHEWFSSQRGPRTTGLDTFWGVPVYDALKATGNQLPYQASWAQLPFWFLRYPLFWKEFIAVHLFVATLCAMMLSLRSLQSWVPKLSVWKLTGVGMVLLSPLGLYTRQNDWTSWYLSTVSMIGLSTALLKKPKPAEDLASGLPLQLSTVLCAGVCLLFIVTGNPGNLPIFLFLGVLLVVRRSLVRPTCYRFLLSRDVPLRLRAALLLLVAAVAVTFLVVVVDVSLQSREGQGLVYSRSAQSQGFRADQGFIGLSDMALERVGVDGQPARDTRRVFEKVASLAVASVALPVLALFRMSLSDITAFDRIAGSFPRGEFTAALVLAAALYALVVIRLGHPLRPLLIRVMTAQLGLWFFGALVNADVLPGILQPSSAWQIAPSILAVNVFLTAVLLWSQETRRTRTVRALCQANLVLAAMWTALQLAVFSVYPTAHAEFPDRNQPFDVDHPALATWLSESADKTSRLALAVTKDHFDNSGRIVSLFLAVSLVERPVFAPSPTKIRSNEHLNQSLTLDSGVPPINLASWRDPQELAKLLSFLQVERLVVPLDDPVLANSQGVINQLILQGLARESAELRLLIPASDNTINKRTLYQSEYGLKNFELQTFSLFAPSSNRGATITKCPLLSDSCELLEQLSPLDPSDAPQVEVCRSGCLWSVKVTAMGSAESQLILPIKFTETLTVTDGSEKLPTFDYAGFLGVNLPPNTDSPSLFVRFDLNATSMLRVVSSYLNSIAVIVVSLSLMIGRTRRQWRSQVVRRI